LREAYAFTGEVYKLYKADAGLRLVQGGRVEEITAGLAPE
jgi:hypothetical protein